MSLFKVFLWVFLIIIIGLFLFFSGFVSFVTDWWWFSEVGYKEVFLKSFGTEILVGLAAGLFTAAFLLGNFLLAAQSRIPWIRTIPEGVIGHRLNINDRITKRSGAVLSILMAIFAGIAASSQWQNFLLFLNATPFGQSDPVFHKDISFYVFSLPVYAMIVNFIKLLTFISLIGCIVVYLLRGIVFL